MEYPDPVSLRCFLAAAEHLNFRRAAEAVALSAAALGERIAGLEESLGVVLFHRTTRSMQLTPAGARLVPQAERVLTESRACFDAVGEDAAPLPYDLTLGTRFELGMSWVTPHLDALESAAPERRLHLYFGDTPELLPLVKSGRIDAMVTSSRLATSGVEVAPLHEEDYAFVARPSLVKRRPFRGPADARDHVLLDLHDDLPLFRYLLDGYGETGLWDFRHIQRLGTIGPVRARVLAGAGVAVLPRYFVQGDLDRGRLVELLGELTLPTDWFRLVWRRGHPRSEALRGLAAELSAFPLA